MRRVHFFGRTIVTGFRWAMGVFNNLALGLTAGVVAIGVGVSGFLLHRPAWFLGVFGVVLLLLVLGEGTYRTWEEANRRALGATSSDSADISLRDQLQLCLKRGQGFVTETSNPLRPDPIVQQLARAWHDNLYKLLVREGRADLGKRWLDETPPIPETPVNFGTARWTTLVLKRQVECLEHIVDDLESEDEPSGHRGIGGRQ